MEAAVLKNQKSSETHDWKKLGEEIFDRISRHEILLLSASFAYTTALALAPFLVIMLAVLAILNPESQQSIIDQLAGLFGSQAGEAVSAIANSAKAQANFSGWSGLISFVVVLVSASAMFSQMRIALDKVNETVPEQSSSIWSFIRERLFSVGLVLGFIFLLVVSLFVTTMLSAIFQGEESLLIRMTSIGINFLVFGLLFSAMFHFVPTKTFPWRRCFVSGACATIFFLAGKSLISIYLGRSAVGSSYGAAGSLAVLLIWLYYSALTLLLSYEFTNTVVFARSVPKRDRSVQ